MIFVLNIMIHLEGGMNYLNIFYILFQHIFQYMDSYMNGRSKLRMMMIGGHDVTIAPLMDFLSGLKIIPRTHFPHFACNVVIEL